MSNYFSVTTKQLFFNSIITSLLFTLMSFFILMVKDYIDLPEVHKNANGECVKVLNFKNGDGYSCQDVDVILKRYIVVHV